MSQIHSNITCPVCQGLLRPKVLECSRCDVRVEGPFQLNEFASLSSEDLHFLRIFIRCEGRVREMEPALGLSYPTIRTRLTQLKNKLVQNLDVGEEDYEAETEESSDTAKILADLEAGEITFEQAMKQIKKARN